MLLILNFSVHFFTRLIKRPFRFLYKKINIEPPLMKLPVDVVIPLVPKDITIAQLCVESLKKFSLNPINNIYIVSPYSSQIDFFCKKNGLVLIIEDDLLPISKQKIQEKVKNKAKIGWFIQQFIKLNSPNIVGLLEKYLVFDADTILMQHQFFYTEKITVLKFSDEFHFLYRLTNYLILNKVNYFPHSFIAHHMLFDKKCIIALQNEICKLHTQPWYEVILNKACRGQYFFSEYELYAQFALTHFPNKYQTQYWFNKNSKIDKYSKVLSKSDFYQSVSFHNYQKETYGE